MYINFLATPDKIYKPMIAFFGMKSFIRGIIEGQADAESHMYFIRFGKGRYRKRFLIKLMKGKNIKVKTSFEFANELFALAKELGLSNFSGKVLTKEKVNGLNGKKKAGLFAYDAENSTLNEFGRIYYALVDGESPGIRLKMKKALPKPGKGEEKIDDSFCTIEAGLEHWNSVKEAFLWDVPECKKAVVEHELLINEIIMPENEKDPARIRELAKRKGKLIRKINADGNETAKEYDLEV